MKVFHTLELEEARAHAAAGGQSLHLHRIIVDRDKAPWCFVNAVDSGQPIAHLFDMDTERLLATAMKCGVRVLFIDRKGTPSQHIDLCSGPLWKACKLLDADQADKLKEVLAALKPAKVE